MVVKNNVASPTSAIRVDFEREGRSVFGQRVVIFTQLLQELLLKG